MKNKTTENESVPRYWQFIAPVINNKMPPYCFCDRDGESFLAKWNGTGSIFFLQFLVQRDSLERRSKKEELLSTG